MILLEIYCSLHQWKNFANQSRIDKVIAMVMVTPFFDSQCTFQEQQQRGLSLDINIAAPKS